MRQDEPPFPGAWRCDRPGHNWWHGTCHRKDGSPCHGHVWEGLTTCRMHPGGNAKVKHLAAVMQRDFPLAVQPVDIHPAEALLWRVRYLAALLKSIDGEVARLTRAEVGWGLERETVEVEEGGEGEPGRKVTRAMGAKLNVWIEYQDRTNKALIAAASAALAAEADQRLVRLAQAQGARAFAAYERGLSRIGLSEEQWERAREGYAQVLSELVA